MLYSADELDVILTKESWRGFDAEALSHLQKSVKKYVDDGYSTMGSQYAGLFEELGAQSQLQIVEFSDRVKSKFPEKNEVHVLDVGAGHGTRTMFLAAQDNVEVKAIEPSEYFYARHLLELEKESKLPLGCAIQGDMCHLPYDGERFEGIYCNAVLHHQLYLAGKNIGIEKAMSEFSRTLLKGGTLYILTLLGDHYHLRQHRFFQSLDEEDMQTLAKRNSLKVDSIEQITGMGPFGEKTKWLSVYLTKRN
jgi:SAM-dependent methyltransferase